MDTSETNPRKTPTLAEMDEARAEFDRVQAAAEAERQQNNAQAAKCCMDYISAHIDPPGTAASLDVLVVASYIDLGGKQRADERYARTVAEAAETIVRKLTGQPSLYCTEYTLEKQQSSGPRPSLDQLNQAIAAEAKLVTETMHRFEDKYASQEIRVLVGGAPRSFKVTAPTRELLEALPEQFSGFNKGAIQSS
jgi:hypothetical protein